MNLTLEDDVVEEEEEEEWSGLLSSALDCEHN